MSDRLYSINKELSDDITNDDVIVSLYGNENT